jgi:hypothetical protein
MSWLDRINQFLTLFSWIPSGGLGHWRAWLPLLALFFVNWLMLYAHREFVHAPFYGILHPWVQLIGGNNAAAFTHYPQQYFLLPNLFSWAKLLVGVGFEGLMLGLVARALHRTYASGRGSGGGRSVVSLWGHLIIIWLALNGLNMIVGYLMPSLLAPLINGPRRLLAFSFGLMPFCFTLIFSLFLFAIPSAVANGEGAFRSMGRSLRLFGRRPFMCFFVAMAILFVPLLLGSILNQPVQVADRFRPELIYWLLVISLACELVANFFWMGTTIRFLVEPEDRK